MASKPTKGREKPAHDRTKRRATPARSGSDKPKESRLSTGCGLLFGAFAWLIFTGGGVAMVVHTTFHDLPWQLGYGTSSVLRMTVDNCEQTSWGKYARYECFGHGDPGNTGVVNEEWLMTGAGHTYASGRVLEVRCSKEGGCQETGTSQVAGDIAGTAFGLLLAGSGLGVVALGIRSRLGSGRLTRRTWTAVGAVAALLGLTGLTAAIVAVAT